MQQDLKKVTGFFKKKMILFGVINKHDALRDLVPLAKFKKREKIPMEESYF